MEEKLRLIYGQTTGDEKHPGVPTVHIGAKPIADPAEQVQKRLKGIKYNHMPVLPIYFHFVIL